MIIIKGINNSGDFSGLVIFRMIVCVIIILVCTILLLTCEVKPKGSLLENLYNKRNVSFNNAIARYYGDDLSYNQVALFLEQIRTYNYFSDITIEFYGQDKSDDFTFNSKDLNRYYIQNIYSHYIVQPIMFNEEGIVQKVVIVEKPNDRNINVEAETTFLKESDYSPTKLVYSKESIYYYIVIGITFAYFLFNLRIIKKHEYIYYDFCIDNVFNLIFHIPNLIYLVQVITVYKTIKYTFATESIMLLVVYLIISLVCIIRVRKKYSDKRYIAIKESDISSFNELVHGNLITNFVIFQLIFLSMID